MINVGRGSPQDGKGNCWPFQTAPEGDGASGEKYCRLVYKNQRLFKGPKKELSRGLPGVFGSRSKQGVKDQSRWGIINRRAGDASWGSQQRKGRA